MLPRTLACCLVLFSSSAVAEEVRVTVTRQDCARLLRHVPAADVAYQPGVGVKGRQVAPADLPGSGADLKVLPDVLEFNIAVNPVGWGERVTAQKAKASAESSLSTAIKDRLAAGETLATLKSEETTLTGTGVTLAQELATLNSELSDLQDDVSDMEAEIAAGTRKFWDQTYRATKRAVTSKEAEVAAKQTSVTGNTAALTANATSQATQQAIIDAAPDKEDSLTADKIVADSTLSSLSGRGLDESSMKIGTVTYDTLKGAFLFNGQPLGAAEAGELAAACAKLGVGK